MGEIMRAIGLDGKLVDPAEHKKRRREAAERRQEEAETQEVPVVKPAGETAEPVLDGKVRRMSAIGAGHAREMPAVSAADVLAAQEDKRRAEARRRARQEALQAARAAEGTAASNRVQEIPAINLDALDGEEGEMDDFFTSENPDLGENAA